LYLRQSNLADEIEEVVDIIRVTKVQLGGLKMAQHQGKTMNN
jgi:hypothetical protein